MGSSRGRGQGWGPGQGSRSGEGSRFGRSRFGGLRFGGQGRGRGRGVKVKGQVWVKVMVIIGGHKVGGQCQGSRSGEWSMSGGGGQGLGGQGLSDWGQMVGGGRLEIKSLFLSRTHDRIEFHSIPFLSNPFHFIPFQSIPFHCIPCFTQCPGIHVVNRIFINRIFMNVFTLQYGERGGSVVERQTPEQEIGGFDSCLRRVVSLSKTLYSQKVLVKPGKRLLRPDMTEKLLTKMLNLKQTIQFIYL